MMAGAFRLGVLLLTAMALGAGPFAQGTVRYVYDEAGRLVAVIDANGDAAAYQYDAVGNLLGITRTTSTQVSIIEFTPDSGSTAQPVTIYGTGFSATPAQNTVSFNGVTATVSSASANMLEVTVPAGATTGAISVTSPNGATAVRRSSPSRAARKCRAKVLDRFSAEGTLAFPPCRKSKCVTRLSGVTKSRSVSRNRGV